MHSNTTLRDAYKRKLFKMGVFQIRNTHSEQVYIGSSLNLDAIWNRHRMELRLGAHRNKALQADWTALGEGGFPLRSAGRSNTRRRC